MSTSTPSGRRLWLAAILVLAITIFGLAGQLYTVASGIGLLQRRQPINVFFRLYALHERPFLLLLLLTTLIAWACAGRDARRLAPVTDRLAALARRVPAWAMALGVFFVA